MLDLVYSTIPSAYLAEPRPYLGYSYHISVRLIPAYIPLIRRSRPANRQVKTWPDCFECTDWQMFREAAATNCSTDLEE